MWLPLRLALAALLVVSALASAEAGAAAAETPGEPVGHLLASLRVVETAQGGPAQARTGVWFYTKNQPADAVGPVVEGYEYSNGKLVDEFGSGGSETELVAAIENLEPFDFERETADAAAKLEAEATANGEVFLHKTRDGTRIELTFVTALGPFKIDSWNPGDQIEGLAPGSEKLAKLKQVLDRMLFYYGRAKLPL